MIDVKSVLEEIKAAPYEEIEIKAPHTGIVTFEVKAPGGKVAAPSGAYLEKPGTLLASITRERNVKPLHALVSGEVASIHLERGGAFVEAGTPLLVLRHYLTKDEVVAAILKRVLHLFTAPERAKYYFIPSVDIKVKSGGCRAVTVKPGMELFIVSRMKREKPLSYDGPEGIIYAIYFQHDDNVEAGQPLIGVCPESQTGLIQDVVNRVHSDWEERN
ncbi:biotin attachment protein [Desulfolutivibrio sp.]|uniref:biotin attachment protein n=1 Tax=Desulfolutivibrio sp. TaxID=2773296 RepID=UPI002F965ECF